MECNKDAMEIINFNEFNDEIKKYNDETKGEFEEFFTSCVLKGGASRNTKLNKYFFIILRCLIFSVFTNEIFRELIFILPPYLVNQISIAFISLLKYIVINRCAAQIPILNDMCPAYKDLLIEFLNNLEIILIKLAPILKYGLGTIINSFAVRDIYNDSKIYYYLLNNPEFIDDIEYPENTEFIVNKNNYPSDFVQEINSAINGPTQTNSEGIVTSFSTHKIIPKHIKKLKYLDRTILQNQGDIIEVDKFIAMNNEYVYLNPIYTRFYINIGYLSVSYISDEQAKIEVTNILKDRKETKQILQLLELKYNVPEQFMRNLSQTLGYGYKSTMIKSNTNPPQLLETNTNPNGGNRKLTKTKKSYKVSNEVRKKSKKVKKRKTRKHFNEVRKK
jgi:hypothetical protein